MKKTEWDLRLILLFIGFGIILPIVLIVGLFTPGKGDEYVKRGKKVQCTVVGVVRFRSSQKITVTYRDKNNNVIKANAINASHLLHVDDKFEAYVLPENPYEVYQKDGYAIKIIAFLFSGTLAALMWLLMIQMFKDTRNYNILKEKGIPIKAELQALNKKEEFILGYFSFTSNTGRQHLEELRINNGTPSVGKEYDVLYYENAKGKCIAALIDIDLT